MNYAVEELEEDVHPRHKTLAEQRRLKLRDVKYVYKKSPSNLDFQLIWIRFSLVTHSIPACYKSEWKRGLNGGQLSPSKASTKHHLDLN